MNRRLKILISAYACNPYRGSEHGVGWGFVSSLAKNNDLWVIVEEEKCRGDIERYLKEHPEFPDSVRFFFLKKQRNRFLRKLWPPSYYWYYREWQREALKLARQLHEEVGFDLAHQLTMVGFREPGYLWQMGIPFVWGPIGGMGVFPWRFLHKIGFYGALYYLGYNLYNFVQMRFMARPKWAAKIAGSALIAATPENRQGAEKYWGCSACVLPEVGLPCNPTTEARRRHKDEPLRIIWVGLHVSGKGLNFGLEALSRLPEEIDWELLVLGKGPLTEKWKRICQNLGIARRCRFTGWLDRGRTLELIEQSHIMLITSLRDLTSTVLVEALAMGIPVVCPDHCGFAYVVDGTCGIKIPVTTPVQFVQGIATAVERLGRDEPLRRKLGEGALERVRDFSWEAKVEFLNEVYGERLTQEGYV